jgi:ribosomal protein S27E
MTWTGSDMVISSRTPEGVPNRCPVCGNDLRIEPSRPTLDAPCPHCGHLLWFKAPGRLTVRQDMIDCLMRLVTERFGPVDPATRAAFERVTEPARLQEMFKRALTCSRLEELVAGL